MLAETKPDDSKIGHAQSSLRLEKSLTLLPGPAKQKAAILLHVTLYVTLYNSRCS